MTEFSDIFKETHKKLDEIARQTNEMRIQARKDTMIILNAVIWLIALGSIVLSALFWMKA